MMNVHAFLSNRLLALHIHQQTYAWLNNDDSSVGSAAMIIYRSPII